MLASLVLRLRPFLLLKTFSSELINEKLAPLQYRITSFLICLSWKDSFGSSVDQDIANKRYGAKWHWTTGYSNINTQHRGI